MRNTSRKTGPRTRLKAPYGLTACVEAALRAANRVPREALDPAGCRIEEEARFLLDEAEALERKLRPSPRLPSDGGEPRLLRIARKTLAEGMLSPALIVRFVRESCDDLTQAEAEMLPAALSCALFEALMPALNACRRAPKEHREALAWAAAFSRGKKDRLPEDEALLCKTLIALSDRADGRALGRAEAALARRGAGVGEVLRKSREREEREALSVRRITDGLRALTRFSFDRITERVSHAARTLSEDKTFRRMDGESRAYYVERACRIAGRCRVSEREAAQAALDLSKEHSGVQGEAGYYLIERPDLIEEALGRRSLRPFLHRHREGLFLLPLYLGAALSMAAAAAAKAPWYAWPFIALCASELLRLVYFSVLRRLFPPRMTPRLRLKSIPDQARTLAVIPTLLASRAQALSMARHMAVLRRANPDKNLEFMLLADFPDGPRESEPGDEETVACGKAAVEALNRAFGGGFFYLHRARRWDVGQRAYTGRDRKRGALESLNHLILEGRCRDAFSYLSLPEERVRGRWKYVLTLDADTFLPPGAPQKMVGAMEHPLQQGRLGVLQPRMEVKPDTVKTYAQRLLGGVGGADVYASRVQDAYQDALGRGSFVGKGIYAPALFQARTRGRLPSGRLLSHDLIEGETVGSAMLDDVSLFDGHPSTLAGWQKRLHRWTRGDWQLLPFLADRRLSLLSRHKIWDNLRRSLVPAAQTALLLLGIGLNVPWLFLLALPYPLRGMGTRLLLLPGKALTALDAAVRALYRQFVSRQNLLSWVTAAQAEGSGPLPMPVVLFQLLCGTAATALALLAGGFLPGVIPGLLWTASPLIFPLLDRKRRPRPLTPAMQKSAEELAQKTWRFFADTVGPETLFLPPDNVQTDPDKGPALRTSPTNIGLYLLSCCAAKEMGLISPAVLSGRLKNALLTLEGMETWRGHFFNWYELKTGAPLPPRFVSTVDSGNLMGCLLCCAQLCRAALRELPEEDRGLPERLDALAERMDFAALYDAKRRLFSVGFDTEQGRLSGAHYGELASEARLTSFLAIMTGQVDREHWKRLNRTLTFAGGGPTLLSWGGTLFEYLMPLLLLPAIPGTLLGESAVNAVRAQIAADPRLPFGISESGYYAFDPELRYQYRAFGLPALAKSADTAGRVIAPYASVLALPLLPRAAGGNLMRMERLGWADRWGFFEAADDTPQRMEKGPKLVKSHMAHHQGMILCSLCNVLCGQALVRAFMKLPAAQAWSILLMERAPKSARRRIALPPPRGEPSFSPMRPCPVRPGLPLEADALFGHGTAWVLSAQGQGYLCHRGLLVTRFFSAAGAQTGPQWYLKDTETGAFIRPTAVFPGMAEEGQRTYRGEFAGLRWLLRFCVDPLTGAALCLIQCENPGRAEKEVEAASFLEIAQSPRRADEAHPNFRDLSVRVLPWGGHGLLSQRLPREENEQIPLIGHGVAGDVAALRRQGDRLRFLGRLGGYARPEQLEKDAEQTARVTGDVIAPCLQLTAKLRVQGQKSASLCFYTVTADTEKELNRLSYTLSRAAEAFSLAALQSRVTARRLRLEGWAMPLYRQILGALAFDDQPGQGAYPPSSLDALWKHGVSGDLPVWTVRLSFNPDQALLRHALSCHAWMRARGVDTDLMLLCPEETAYARPCRDRAARLVDRSPERDALNRPGGVHIVSVDDAEARRLESLAKLPLRGGESLKNQLAALQRPLPQEAALSLTPARFLPGPALRYHNSFGGFTQDGAYRVNAPAPAPWHHIVCGERFGTLVCETGILHSYAHNSRLNRITRLSPDVHRALPAEEIYLLDGEGRAYSLLQCPARFSPGIAEYAVRGEGFEAETVVCADPENPFGARLLTVKSNREQRIELLWLVRFSMGERPGDTRCLPENSRVLARSPALPGVAWAAMEDGAAGALCQALCFGTEEKDAPPALWHTGSQGGSVGALRWKGTLRARESRRVTLGIGCAPDEERAGQDWEKMLSVGAAQLERNARAFWGKSLGRLVLFSTEDALEIMLNVWLPYQALAARLLSRMGPYQQGGAYGFRDQLQDCLAFMLTDPERVRAHLLRCAAHQFTEGDAQHWWHSPRRGVRTRISDDKLFLPFVAARYIAVTGDQGVLDEEIPYLVSEPLRENEKERYEEPEVSESRETLLAHCMRAIDSVALGAHGVPLMGGGDWNDGMNRVGGEKGESVWLGFFFAWTLQEFAPFCPADRREEYLSLRRRVLDGLESAWMDPWYLRAWRDDGRPLAGPDTDPPRIDLISQCFAVLGGAPRHHARKALQSAAQRLYDRERGLVLLLDPPFTPEENAGYIGAYLPGVRENGGQYTHAAAWLVMALRRVGDFSLAWEIARALLPVFHADTKEKAEIYRLEPYALAGDVYAGQNAGRGGWSWYTGGAAWLWYVIVTELLGFEKQGSRARLNPALSRDMDGFTLVYRFGASNYHFTAARDTLFPTLDGARLEDGWAALSDDGRTHEARFPIRDEI